MATDEAYMSMTMPTKATWPLLWTHCDDFGVFEWKPIVFKASIFPADNINFEVILSELEQLNCVQKVAISGKPYGLVRNFCRYQRPQKPAHRVPLPENYWNYVGLNADGRRPNPQSAPTSQEAVADQYRTGTIQTPQETHRSQRPVSDRSATSTGAPPQMEDGGDNRKRKKGESSSHIDKPVVVVVAREPEIAASTTTTTQAENDLALQVVPAAKPVNPLGTTLPEDWIPNDDCMKIAFDSGMDSGEVESEVLRFHAFNAQRGRFSQNWNKTWTLWCAEFKRRKAKDDAKAPPRVEVSKVGARFVPTEKDWDDAAKLYLQMGRWHVDFGPEPTSPACRCPPDILAKHRIGLDTGYKIGTVPSMRSGPQ